MKPPPPVAVAWFRGVEPVPVPGPAVLPWARLVDRLTTFPHLPAGLDKRAAPGWAPLAWAEGAPHRRAAVNVGALSALVFDLDALPGGLDALDRAAAELRGNAPRAPLACAWHTSWRSTEDEPRARLVLPLAEPCPVARWPAVWAAAARWLRAEVQLDPDPACKDAGRWYLLPGLPEDAARERWQGIGAASHPGAALDWRWLVADWPEPPPPPSTARPPERTRPDADWRDLDARRAEGWMRGKVRALKAIPEGGRNTALLAALVDAYRLSAAGHLADRDRWCADLRHVARERGLGDAEVTHADKRAAHIAGEKAGWIWPND